MPRRNLLLLIGVALLSILCYQKVQNNRYSEALVKAFDLIQRRYLEPIDGETLFEGGVKGMVDRLDPNSSYFTAASYQEFIEGIEQEFAGVGMEVSADPQTKQLTVVSPLVDSPAYKAGILAGDKILAIDGRSTLGIALEDTVQLMRGPTGSSVVLSVLHAGQSKPVEVTIVRAVIQVDSVLGDTRNADGTWNFFLQGFDRIGYLRINSFGDKTAQEMAAAMQKLAAGNFRGLVLDLRNDPGGRLDAAVAICDLFINSGVIVTTRGRGGQIKQTYEARPKADFREFPLAVLVNRHSASASEIVAACLQDHHRAVIIGERTFGKGTVQELLEWPDNLGALKLTTASYWRPSNRNINKPKDADANADWGVIPDPGYQVPVDEEDLARWFRWRRQRDGHRHDANGDTPDPKSIADAPLLKALEYLDKSLK
jgi:carboxyl-terminal processing protease